DNGGDHRNADIKADFNRAGDGLGLAAFLRADTGIGAGGVDKGQNGNSEMIGEPHQPLRLAVSFRAGHTEIMPDAGFRILAFFRPDHDDAAAAEPAEAADNRLVIGKSAITGKRHEILDQPGGDIAEFGTIDMAGDLRFLPRRQLRIGLLKLLHRLLAQLRDIFLDLDIAGVLKPFELADFAFEISYRLLKIKEIIHKSSRPHRKLTD